MQAATQQALAGNAELQVLQKRIDEARARVALAEAMRHPDPVVIGGLTYDAPGEFTFGWRAGAAIALPIFTTGRPEVAVAEATLERAIADRDARVAQITGAVARGAGARRRRAPEPSIAIRTKSCRRRCRSSRWPRSRIAPGQTGLPAYLQTLQAARDIRQRALQAGLDYQLALADLERADGSATAMTARMSEFS